MDIQYVLDVYACAVYIVNYRHKKEQVNFYDRPVQKQGMQILVRNSK